MTLSTREMVLGAATLAALLLGGTALLMQPRYDAWKALRAEQDAIRRDIGRDRRLVEQRGAWADKFDELSAGLTEYPIDQKMDVVWLSIVDAAAKKHGVDIRRLQAGRETQEGEVYELPIECREWEGSLEAVVRFLFELQSRGAMLDIRHLMIRPKAGDVLRGRFSLYCAYTRAGDSAAPPDGPESP